MRTLCIVPLLLLFAGCHSSYDHYNGNILIAVRDIPAGTVLQHSDLRLDHGWILLHSEDTSCLSDPLRVLGHKTLRPLAKGETLHASNIEGLNQLSYPCPERVADGWDGYKQDPSRYYNNPFTEGYNDHILIAVRDLPAGTVLQVSDLTFDHGSTIYSDDVACLSEPSDVIGWKTLRPVAKGEILHASNIERSNPPYLCRDVADGWDGYRQTGHR